MLSKKGLRGRRTVISVIPRITALEAAMMGRRGEQWSLFYQFRLDERVPKDHLLRRINRFVTAAFARSCPTGVHGSAACLGSGDGAGFLGAEGDSDGHGCSRWAGGANTSSPPALAPYSATRAAARQNAAAASPVGNHDAQKDAGPPVRTAAPVPPPASAPAPVSASSEPAYAVQLTSEPSAAEAHASFRALRAKFPNQLGGREPIVRRVLTASQFLWTRQLPPAAFSVRHIPAAFSIDAKEPTMVR